MVTKIQTRIIKRKNPPINVALVICMDDAIRIEGAFMVGAGGSLDTAQIGNQSFPQKDIELVNRLRIPAYAALATVANRMGARLEVSSHEGCGWETAQGKDDKRAQADTEIMVKTLKSGGINVVYRGFISYSIDPQPFGGNDVLACIVRPGSDHHHTADGIIFTTGGFATQDEIDQLLAEYGWQKAFLISADWIHNAVQEQGVSYKDAQALLVLQRKLANKIMDKNLPVVVFDANKLPDCKADNLKAVKMALAG